MRSHAVILDIDRLLLDTEPFQKRAWQEAALPLLLELLALQEISRDPAVDATRRGPIGAWYRQTPSRERFDDS